MEPRGEIVFLGVPADMDWEASPYLKALYATGILTIAFTPIIAEVERPLRIEEVITAATRRVDVVCVMSTRLQGWQAREALLRKLLYRISQKRLMLDQGVLLPAGTSHHVDLNGIPLFILPFTIAAPSPHPTVLIMTPGTADTVYPFQSKIKEAIALTTQWPNATCGRWIRMRGVNPTEIVEWIQQSPYYTSIRFKIIPKVADLDLIIASDKPASLSDAVAGIRKKFDPFCYSFDGEFLEEAVGAVLLANGATLAIAESCTGGQIAAKITRIPGASRYFIGATVTYSNASKEQMLSIPHQLIHKNGAVSEAVAVRMATEIRKSTSADIGLSVTGIAGPTGASREKPIGLVYIALANAKNASATCYRFYGSRDEIREQAAQMALEMVLRHFKKINNL